MPPRYRPGEPRPLSTVGRVQAPVPVASAAKDGSLLLGGVPTSSEEAQYSVAYPVAAALLHGDVGPEQVLEERYRDARAAVLCQRTEFVQRSDYQEEFPGRRLAEVKITGGGRTYSSGTVAAHGDPSDPLSSAEIEDKFRRYVRPYLRASEADDILARVSRLETLTDKDVQGIIASLVAARRKTETL